MNTVSEKSVPSGPKRLFALDVLRGLAAVLVLIVHIPEPYTYLSYSDSANWGAILIAPFKELGWIGVDLFFVLSGFLISGLLYREVDETGGLKVKRFLLRRGFKIWPSYFAAYGGMTLLVIGRSVVEKDWSQSLFQLKKIFFNSIFIQNYLPAKWRWTHSWSIAIEEHFYLLLPLVFVFFLVIFRKSEKKLIAIPWFCLTMIILCPVMRMITVHLNSSDWIWNTNSYDWRTVYYPSHLRADSLCFGVLIGYLFRYHRPLAVRIASTKMIGIPLVLFSFAVPLIWNCNDHWFCGTIGFSLIALGFSWLVLAAGVFPETGKTGWKIVSIPGNGLAWIGIYSYTIYLAHSIIFGIPGVDWSRRHLIRFAEKYVNDVILIWIDYACFWVLSILLGILISKVIELPLLKLRSKLVPSHYASQNNIPKNV